MLKMAGLAAVTAALMQVQAGDPLKVVREKGFYKTGAAAKNTSFVEWLKRPVFGEESAKAKARTPGSETNGTRTVAGKEAGGSFFGLLNSRPIKTNAALQTIRDQGYKEKEARMRAKWEAEHRRDAATQE